MVLLTRASVSSSTRELAQVPTLCAFRLSFTRHTGIRLSSKTCGPRMVANRWYSAWVIRKLYFLQTTLVSPLNLNRTGFGHHGDYLFGWEGDSLQRAMNKCLDDFGTPEKCKELTVLSDDEINKCIQPVKINEKTEGECKPPFL